MEGAVFVLWTGVILTEVWEAKGETRGVLVGVLSAAVDTTGKRCSRTEVKIGTGIFLRFRREETLREEETWARILE